MGSDKKKESHKKGAGSKGSRNTRGSEGFVKAEDLQAFFTGIANEFSKLNSERQVLISIPVWGFTGDGKTSAIVTATHYMRLTQHGLQLDTVTYESDLKDLEDDFGYTLGGLAQSTRHGINELRKTMIEESQWLHGTDAASAYLFKIVSRAGIHGALYIPDLPGGNYQEGKLDADGVLAEAHGIVILVDPTRYAANGVDARNYQGEILARIQVAARRQLPFAVLITKSDGLKTGAPQETVDTVRTELTMILDGVKTLCAIFEVSVVGRKDAVEPAESSVLPKEADRKPESLVKAWIWITFHSLAATLRQKSPSLVTTSIQSHGSRRALAGARIVEIRHLGDFSGVPGKLTATADEGALAKTRVTVVNAEGKLFESIWNSSERSGFEFHDAGSLDEFGADADLDLKIEEAGPNLLIGPRHRNDVLWIGGRANVMRRTQLPAVATSWSRLGPDKIVILNEEGKLFSLQNADNKWGQTDYHQAFPASKIGFVKYLADERLILFSNGSLTKCIALSNDGKFGEQRESDLKMNFGKNGCKMEGDWYAGSAKDNSVVVGQRGAVHSLQKLCPGAELFDVGRTHARVCFLAEGGVLSIALLNNESEPHIVSFPQALSEPWPVAMSFAVQDRFILLYYETGVISTFELLGTGS